MFSIRWRVFSVCLFLVVFFTSNLSDAKDASFEEGVSPYNEESSAYDGGASPFDWWRTKDNWRYSWGSLPDERIPANQHTIKKSINDTVDPNLCGIGKENYDAIKTYAVDYSGDGEPDYVLDETDYFHQGINTDSCPIQICESVNSEGESACQIAFFTYDSLTQILTDPKDTTSEVIHVVDPCPENASDNKSCRPECPASTKWCPHLFQYNMTVAMSRFAYKWRFIDPEGYTTLTKDVTSIYGRKIYSELPNKNRPVLVIDTIKSACTSEELDQWQNRPKWKGRCIKFFQYLNGNEIADEPGKKGQNAEGRFQDLYNPTPENGTAQNDTRITTKEFDANYALIREETDNDRTWMGKLSSPTALKLPDGKGTAQNALAVPPAIKNAPGVVAIQFSTDGEMKRCRVIRNTSSNKYLLPWKSLGELDSFINHIDTLRKNYKSSPNKNPLKDLTESQCGVQYTPWAGTTTCPALACGQKITIGAERRCQRASSAYGACEECDNITDPSTVNPHECMFKKVCYGGPCPPHHSCVPANTKILMADGSQKPISEIKIGDTVMGFNKGDPSAPAHPALVKSLMLTEKSDLLQINDLKITKGHTVVLKSGMIVPARSVKKGDKLLDASGKTIVVKTTGSAGTAEMVYNFDLKNADGYIANGIRILAYPLPDK